MADLPQNPEPAPTVLDYAPAPRQRWFWMTVLNVLVVLGLAGFVISMFLPTLGNPKERANIVKCASQLHQIGQALALYANDNRGLLPPRLDVLLNDPYIDPVSFCCPATSDTIASGSTTQAVIAAFNQPGHCSYVYFGGSINGKPADDMVIAMENPANHGDMGVNILFGDGHVEWFSTKEAARIRAELQAGHNPPRPAQN